MRLLSALVLVFAAVAGAAHARVTAEDLLRQEMAKRGIHRGVDYRTREARAYDPAAGAEWSGLTLTQAVGFGGGQWTHLAVVQNNSGQAYCIRPRAITVNADPNASVTLQNGNMVVEPGAYLVVYAASSRISAYTHDTSVDFAFWRPNRSVEYSRQCRSVAPSGLDDWLMRQDRYPFNGSSR